MVRRASAPIGAPIWIDVMTSNPAATQAFYGSLFDWLAVDPGPEYGGYVNFHLDGEPVAGFMPKSPEMEIPDVWSVYLATDDAKATVDAAAAHGGQVIVPAMDVHELGTMAVVTDPGGAAVGMWQPGLHTGVNVLVEPGAPHWFELHTRDFAASVDFYRDVFGWDVHPASDTPELRSSTLFGGEQAAAGIVDAERVPARRRARPLGRLLQRARRRRRAGQGRRARRRRRPTGRGHPVRPPGGGDRLDRRHVQALPALSRATQERGGARAAL